MTCREINSKEYNCLNNYEKNGDLNLYNQSRFINDICHINTNNRQSEYSGKYMISNFKSCDCTAPNVSRVSQKQPNIYYRDGYGSTSINGCNIDKDSFMRNGSKITNQGNCKKQLFERPYLSVPFMGRGLGDSFTESELITGDQTGSKRQCNTLAEITINNNFIPLVPNLKCNVQNTNNLITENAQKGWLRGGTPSRQIIKNIDYGEKCSAKYTNYS
jgi:hypothetical protein